MKQARSQPKSRRLAPVDPVGPLDFASQAENVFVSLRAAMARLVEALPQPMNRAVDVQRALGVYAPLAWRVFRIASADDPLNVAEFVPTPGHVQTLIHAAAARKLPAQVISDVQAAFAAYEVLRQSHAGSRERLRSMVASLRPAASDLIDAKCRRGAFEHNSLIWGVQTDVIIGCTIMHDLPHSDNRMAAGITGRVGFHAVRPAATAGFVSSVSGDTSGESAQKLDRKLTVDSALLAKFCSSSLAAKRSWQADQWARTRVGRQGIGKLSSVNYFQVVRNEQGPDEPVELDFSLKCPAAALHMDLLVPRAWNASLASACVYGNPANPPAAYQHRPGDRIPVAVNAVHMGTSKGVPPAVGVPDYPDIVQTVLQDRGWQDTEFDVFRCRMAYPILHAVVHLGVSLGKSTPKPGT